MSETFTEVWTSWVESTRDCFGTIGALFICMEAINPDSLEMQSLLNALELATTSEERKRLESQIKALDYAECDIADQRLAMSSLSYRKW